jgi:CheY-like chemotaxis protein
LGLSTVFGIIKQHSGFVEVESHVGTGTIFKVYMPENFDNLALTPQATQETISKSHSAARILVVEDSRPILDFVQFLLEGAGHTVLATEFPEEALILAGGDETIDLLVSDVVMPQMSGPELYERLLEARPGLKVLFMSGYPDSVEILRKEDDNTVDFIAKPFTSEAFLKHVEP